MKPRENRAAYGRQWRAKNREHYREYFRAYYAKRKLEPAYRAQRKLARVAARRKAKYGITRAQYEALLANQNGRCLICGSFVGRDLRVDHDHVTGKVRGLLCSNCNAGIGLLKENPQTLQSAIEYLSTRP